jgi:FixJ family two-component response regulator
VPAAVRAVKAGAMDVVQKPYRDENLLDSINKALQADAAANN